MELKNTKRKDLVSEQHLPGNNTKKCSDNENKELAEHTDSDGLDVDEVRHLLIVAHTSLLPLIQTHATINRKHYQYM